AAPYSGETRALRTVARTRDDLVEMRVAATPRRPLPLGLQQALPIGDDHLRRQQPARQPLGRQDLQRRPHRHQGPPARRPHPRPHAARTQARHWILALRPGWLTVTPENPPLHGTPAALAMPFPVKLLGFFDREAQS